MGDLAELYVIDDIPIFSGVPTESMAFMTLWSLSGLGEQLNEIRSTRSSGRVAFRRHIFRTNSKRKEGIDPAQHLTSNSNNNSKMLPPR
jgi:hypothetical protein